MRDYGRKTSSEQVKKLFKLKYSKDKHIIKHILFSIALF